MVYCSGLENLAGKAPETAEMADSCGFQAAPDALFAPCSTGNDGTEVGTRPRLLDLFCSAGGAGMGYHQAGFDVVGVDIRPQPRYPFEFIQADVLSLDPGSIACSFHAVHASPPCQAHTSMKTMHNAREHHDLVPATREMLRASQLPYAIENVVGAPLDAPIMLCGTMFGLGAQDADLLRHRLFEMSEPPLFVPQCQHGRRATLGVYGGHVRNRKRVSSVGGEGARGSRGKLDKGVDEFTVEDAREAMGIDWMTLAELCQAIPPAYTRWIGQHLMEQVAACMELR